MYLKLYIGSRYLFHGCLEEEEKKKAVWFFYFQDKLTNIRVYAYYS